MPTRRCTGVAGRHPPPTATSRSRREPRSAAAPASTRPTACARNPRAASTGRASPWVREQWAREHGLEGVDGPDYDRHLDAVLGRIGATDALSDLNGPQQWMKRGCEALGWDFRKVVRNADPERYSYDSAGYLGFGDQSGSKNSADKTWLLDAVQSGADVLVRTRADRVLVEGGRGAGVGGTEG